MKSVPFFNLSRQTANIKSEVMSVIESVIDSSAFASGPFVKDFEGAFADFCEAKHCVAVANGTDALLLALLALGVVPGDEIITVPNTFIATSEAISQAGAKPVYVDIDPLTFNMEAAQVRKKITKKTKAILPVHLFGQPFDVASFQLIAEDHGLLLVEDACQAHGARYHGKRVGALGDAGCFSFYPGKNLGAFGEAGAVVTNNSAVAEKIAQLRDHGQSKKYFHDVWGYNGRCDGIQGGVLKVKLGYLEGWNKKRREIAQFYSESLKGHPRVSLPIEPDFAESVYHLYVVRVEDRKTFTEYLDKHEIGWGLHYPVPLHLTPAYADLGYQKGDFPIAEKYADQIVSLPMFPELTLEEMIRVTEVIKSF